LSDIYYMPGLDMNNLIYVEKIYDSEYNMYFSPSEGPHILEGD